MKLSVIICTHNPRPHYMRRVLDALQAQTFPKEFWELLVIDNISALSLAETVDLSFHPRAKVIREEHLGLTPSRLRGIREASGEVLLFVDDDNVLDPLYLEIADQIGRSYPFLGAWGSGTITPSFDTPPPEWVLPYVRYLTVGEREDAAWANIRQPGQHVPAGAGICVRRPVALQYLAVARESKFRTAMDRRGSSLVSGGDVDMALTACDMGLGTGVFPELKLTHLIPESRLDKTYLLKLVEEMAWSNGALGYLRGQFETKKKGFMFHLVKNSYYFLRLRGFQRDFFFAELRGEERAQRDFGHKGKVGGPAARTFHETP